MVSETTHSDEEFVVSNDRRRHALMTIYHESEIGLSELADIVAHLEFGGDYTRMQWESVKNSLYQYHIPKLSDRGVVVPEGNQYRPGPDCERYVDATRHFEEEHPDPMPHVELVT